MKNFLYKHWQRTIGVFMGIIGIIVYFAICVLYSPEDYTNLLAAHADNLKKYKNHK